MTRRAAARRAARMPPEKPRAAAVVVHDLGQAVAALRAAVAARRPVTLWSAEGAGIYAGPGWFAAVERQARGAVPAARASFVLDCAERPDLVQEAFRAGIRAARFAGPRRVAEKLADIAARRRAVLHRRRPRALDLLNAGDPETATAAYLAGN